MIITHTVNCEGKRRIYLGGKFSLEGWIEEADAHTGWRFRCDIDDNSYLSPDQVRAWATSLLTQLAAQLSVSLADLPSVPFDTIATLHTVSRMRERHIPAPQRDAFETGYMTTPPGVKRAKTDFTASDFRQHHGKGRSRGVPA